MQLRVLDDNDIGRIHEATLEILEGTGILFQRSPSVVELCRKAGCRISGERVHFPKSVVEEALSRIPDHRSFTFFNPGLGTSKELGLGKGETHFGIIGNAYYFYDYQKRLSRDVTETDLKDKLLVFDSLASLQFDACGMICHSDREGRPHNDSNLIEEFRSAPALLRHWVTRRLTLDAKKLPLSYPWVSPEVTRLIILSVAVLEGSTVRVREHMARMEDSAFTWCNPISPLQYHPNEAESIIATACGGRKYRTVMISPEIMMGATGPVTLAGALVQHNCEVLGGAVLAQIARPGTPVIYGHVSAPMDLRTTEISHGNFETFVLNAAVVQMADRYGMPSRITPGNTSAKSVGERSAVEAAVGMFIGAAAGGNIVMTGLLDSTLMISYEHLVLVDELINQLRSAQSPIRTDAESLAVNVIGRAAGGGQSYLESDHTVRFMKRDLYLSEFTGEGAGLL